MKNMIRIFVLLFAASIFGQHSFPIVEYPTWVVKNDTTITIGFVDIDDDLGNCDIWFSRNPGGANIANYSEKIGTASPIVVSSYNPLVKQISFKLPQNTNFRAGINYVIVSNIVSNTAKKRISNEVKIIVKHSAQSNIISPRSGLVNNTTPTLSWTKPSGVPYSHVLLSDEKIDISGAIDGMSLESINGVSMIWQTITKDNSVTYGEPDQSGIFATAPPPLSPGKDYSWFVFNNYGNSPAFTAGDVSIPGFFGISPNALGPGAANRKTPENVFPVSANKDKTDTLKHTDNNGNITFRWKNLDPTANIYKVFVYTQAPIPGGVNVQILVWSDEVTAGQFPVVSNTSEAQLSMSAKDILSDNEYSWRVVTMYSDGSGQAGDLSKFHYDSPSGTINVKAYEKIIFGGHTFTQELALAEIEAEVLQGSLEETIFFFTDNTGGAERSRSVGTHRISIKKEGYSSENKIVQIRDGETAYVEFYLSRPFSSIYGKITDSTTGVPVNLANIIAVSDNGDTVKTQSLPDGNYVLNCSFGDWTITVGRQDFINKSQRVQLPNETNKMANFQIKRNPHTFSGIVTNEDGNPVTGATVRILSGDGNTEIASLLSTPSDGRFSFSLAAGVYKITATKTGLAPVERTVTVSSSQNMQITLPSGAAMLKGTLYGVSWLANSTGELVKNSAAVINAKLEVIDTTNKKDSIIITTTTDKVYGTYAVSVPSKSGAGFNYKLKFTAEGFDALNNAFTNATNGIEKGNTYSQNFDINAFATIEGKVIPVHSDVSVSLIRTSDQVQVAVAKTGSDGKFTFFRIPAGNYKIFANGNGRTKDFVEQTLQAEKTTSDETTVEGGKFRAGNPKHDVSFINIHTKEANATIIWTAKTSPEQTAHDPSIIITVYSPLVQTLDNENNKLENAALGVRYLARATSSDSTIIACVQRALTVNNEEETDVILMPFKYKKSEKNDTTIAKLELSKWAGVAVAKAQAFYRRKGETKYDSTTTNVNPSDVTVSFDADLGSKAGSDIEYYFRIETADGTIYGNEKYPYTKFVAADPKIISHWEVLPMGNSDSITLALDGRMDVYVEAYFGSNYEKIKDISGRFSFGTNNSKILNVSPANASAIITGKSAGEAELTVSLNGTTETKKTIVKVTNSKIDKIEAVLRSRPENSSFIKNTESVIFGVEARDKSGELVSATPSWLIKPSILAKNFDVRSGLFKPDSTFVGRAYIVAQINSKVRHEFSLGGEKGVLIAHPVMQNADTTKAVNYSANDKKTAELKFKHDENPIIVTLDNPELKNFILHNVEKDADTSGGNVFIISDVFEIKRHSDENLNAEVKLYVPEIYHNDLKNGQSDESKLDIAVWDEDSLTWRYPLPKNSAKTSPARDDSQRFIDENATYKSEEKSLSLNIEKFLNKLNGNIRLGIIGRGLETDVMVEVSPNPFSPFVSPMNDYSFKIRNMNSEVKGTCIKITPKASGTKYKPSAKVSIYSAEGTMVYHTELNGLNPGETYYLFWDGRKQLSRAGANKIEVEPNSAIFTRGDEMCRNGRYFVNVTIDDVKEKKRYTKEIILFK
ncbi:MAG: carboxypeptidase-like regulatory domain-containing protein [Chitinivibrionia bacterium]|nr:carboxypeptidase-like regulatory domain-containing protein [Chitinivibrionia bacterium]